MRCRAASHALRRRDCLPLNKDSPESVLRQGILRSSLRTPYNTSAERKREGLDAWIEKLDVERSVDDRLRLSNQLMQTLFARNAGTLLVDIESVSLFRSLPVEQDAIPYWRTAIPWPHHEVKISAVKAVRDTTSGMIERDRLFSDGPVALQRPLIEAERSRR